VPNQTQTRTTGQSVRGLGAAQHRQAASKFAFVNFTAGESFAQDLFRAGVTSADSRDRLKLTAVTLVGHKPHGRTNDEGDDDQKNQQTTQPQERVVMDVAGDRYCSMKLTHRYLTFTLARNSIDAATREGASGRGIRQERHHVGQRRAVLHQKDVAAVVDV
jgi:hypothetical protein